QREYDTASVELDKHRISLRTLDLVEGPDRDNKERSLAGAIAKTESKLSDLSRKRYLCELLKGFLVCYVPSDSFVSLAWLFAVLVVAVALKGVFEFLQESLVGSV